MRIITVILSMLVLLLLFSSGAAQEGESPFTLYSAQPIVSHSPTFRDWDGRYTDPGAVFYHDGQFHMFRNGFQNWPASVQIGYLTSPNGMTWTEMSEDPVLHSDDVPFAGVAALASSALVEADGTWVLYFYTWNDSSDPQGTIGRATASDPLGAWTVDPEPVLTRGSAGSWDSEHVDAPSVIHTDDGYLMYYAGASGMVNGLAFMSQIGLATSDDGIHWTKYDDPATVAAPYAESDPVLSSNRENYVFHQPRVEQTDDGYVMVFRMAPTARALTGQMELGIATSVDGIHWEVVTPEPVWERDTIPGVSSFWYTATAYHDGTLYLYIEGGIGDTVTDIYLATTHENFFD